jgi:hypothetical protein
MVTAVQRLAAWWDRASAFGCPFAGKSEANISSSKTVPIVAVRWTNKDQQLVAEFMQYAAK